MAFATLGGLRVGEYLVTDGFLAPGGRLDPKCHLRYADATITTAVGSVMALTRLAAHLARHAITSIELTIGSSKTDQEGRGATLAVGAAPGHEACAGARGMRVRATAAPAAARRASWARPARGGALHRLGGPTGGGLSIPAGASGCLRRHAQRARAAPRPGDGRAARAVIVIVAISSCRE